jgi:hypothetical protein
MLAVALLGCSPQAADEQGLEPELQAINQALPAGPAYLLKDINFDNPVTIYLDGVLELDGSFDEAVLVNYRTEPSVPAQGGEDIVPYEAPSGRLEQIEPSKEGQDVVPFVDFGGLAFSKGARKEGCNAPARGRSRSTACLSADEAPSRCEGKGG